MAESMEAMPLGYEFRNEALRTQALTHSSLVNEPEGRDRRSNTRLAHLGDAVVELAVRAELYRRFPAANQGQLTNAKQALVRDEALAQVVVKLGLAQELQRGRSRPPSEDNATVQSELFEALVGAIFLDSDYETAAKVVVRHLMPDSV